MEEDFKKLLEKMKKKKEKNKSKIDEYASKAKIIIDIYNELANNVVVVDDAIPGITYDTLPLYGVRGIYDPDLTVEKDDDFYITDYFTTYIGYDPLDFINKRLKISEVECYKPVKHIKMITDDYKIFSSSVFGTIKTTSRQNMYLDKFINQLNWFDIKNDMFKSWRKVYFSMDLTPENVAYINKYYYKNTLLFNLTKLKYKDIKKTLEVEDCIKKLFE